MGPVSVLIIKLLTCKWSLNTKTCSYIILLKGNYVSFVLDVIENEYSLTLIQKSSITEHWERFLHGQTTFVMQTHN